MLHDSKSVCSQSLFICVNICLPHAYEYKSCEAQKIVQQTIIGDHTSGEYDFD